MIRKNIRVVFSTFIVGVLVGTLTTVVSAATAYSNTGYFGPVNGYSHQNYAMVSSTSSTVHAATAMETQGGGTVPTGYMAARANLYKSDALCLASDEASNNSSASRIDATTFIGNACGSGTYNSKGTTSAYNGSTGYNHYFTFVSPNITY